MIASANQIALLIFNQSEKPVSIVTFRGMNHPFNWFHPENIISSSLWNLSPETANLVLTFDSYGFDITDYSSSWSVEKFFKISCSGSAPCDMKYSSASLSKAESLLDSANRIKMFTKPRFQPENHAELQLQYSVHSNIGNIKSFFDGSQKEDHNLRNNFRAVDFDQKIQNAGKIILKIYRSEFGSRWIEFDLRNATFNQQIFSREHIYAESSFNFFQNTTFKTADSTGGYISVITTNASEQNLCSSEYFWFKIICRNTTTMNCGFDWSKYGSNCAILFSGNGTSWANRHYLTAYMIEIYSESLTKAFNFDFEVNVSSQDFCSDIDIISFYKLGDYKFRNQTDLDPNFNFRHYKMEKLFTECYYVKFRYYSADFGPFGSNSGDYFIEKEIIFKCGKIYTNWFTVANFVRTSTNEIFTESDTIIQLFHSYWAPGAFLIADRNLVVQKVSGSDINCADEMEDSSSFNVEIAENYGTNFSCPGTVNCKNWPYWWASYPVAKLEVFVDSSKVRFQKWNKKWQLVFMVEAFSGVHIYNFYKTGSTDPAVPGLSKVQFGGHFFRHPDLESRILGSNYIRFSVYNLDKTYVVNDIIFINIRPKNSFEDWFNWDRVLTTSQWNFSDSLNVENGGHIFSIQMEFPSHTTHRER